ncbi:FAD-binding oxidoreductase [Sporichthya brevicatena]|uniref:FAD-binding oxidoreductase n=1 Tax=Sporichthya brevicatena TaxID=171442 RepID=A0ABP3SH55_9ACTN
MTAVVPTDDAPQPDARAANAALTLDELRERLTGDLVRPGDPDWDVARAAWNLTVDQQPAAVVLAETVSDVVETLLCAADLGLGVAPQGTGHNAAPLGPLDGTVLLKTSRMRGVDVDPAARVARVEAGAPWGEVTAEVAAHGLTALAGSAHDVGVVGYTLGGGLSWLGRHYGLASNHVRAVECVTADGRELRVDAEHHADLFWALRGGGGGHAVVTALEFDLFEVPDVYAGVLFFPIERAGEVLHAWRHWVADVPDTVTSVGRLLQFLPLPELPDFLRGRSYVVVEAVVVHTAEADAAALLAPLRALGPEIDTFAMTPTSALQSLHMDPEGPVPGIGDGYLVGELPAEGIDALVAACGPGSGSALLSVELRHLGGALAPDVMAGGAVSSLAGEFAMFAVGMTPGPEFAAKVRADIDAVQEALQPWASGRAYANFAERRRAGAVLFGPEAHDRLQAVKAVYDPENVIRAAHQVTPKLST